MKRIFIIIPALPSSARNSSLSISLIAVLAAAFAERIAQSRRSVESRKNCTRSIRISAFNVEYVMRSVLQKYSLLKFAPERKDQSRRQLNYVKLESI